MKICKEILPCKQEKVQFLEKMEAIRSVNSKVLDVTEKFQNLHYGNTVQSPIDNLKEKRRTRRIKTTTNKMRDENKIVRRVTLNLRYP